MITQNIPNRSFGTRAFISFDRNEMKSHSKEDFILWDLDSNFNFLVWLPEGICERNDICCLAAMCISQYAQSTHLLQK